MIEYAVVNPATGETVARYDSFTDAEVEHTLGTAEAGFETWRKLPVAELLGWWWLSFLASVLVRSITTEAVHAAADLMLLGLLPEQFERFQPSAGMQVLADLLTVLCGLLALRVVRRTTARQQERATRLAATGAIARR